MKMAILLVSHAGLAEGMRAATEFVAGKQAHFYALGLDEDGVEIFKNKLLARFKQLEQEVTQLVILCDIPSGSPGSSAFVLAQQIGLEVKMIAGMNLALVLEVVLMREVKDFSLLVFDAVNSALASITIMEETNQEEEIDIDVF